MAAATTSQVPIPLQEPPFLPNNFLSRFDHLATGSLSFADAPMQRMGWLNAISHLLMQVESLTESTDTDADVWDTTWVNDNGLQTPVDSGFELLAEEPAVDNTGNMVRYPTLLFACYKDSMPATNSQSASDYHVSHSGWSASKKAASRNEVL